ncbi:MAG: hypothetical protein WCK27_01305 [Verrucomicrobiota bacterium]
MTVYRQLPAVNTDLKAATAKLEAGRAGGLAEGCYDSWQNILGNNRTMKIRICIHR